MSDPNDIASREAGPLLEPNEKQQGEGRRWAILVGFAAMVMLAALSVNHNNDAPSAPPAASTATAPGLVTAPPAPAPPSGG